MTLIDKILEEAEGVSEIDKGILDNCKDEASRKELAYAIAGGIPIHWYKPSMEAPLVRAIREVYVNMKEDDFGGNIPDFEKFNPNQLNMIAYLINDCGIEAFDYIDPENHTPMAIREIMKAVKEGTYLPLMRLRLPWFIIEQLRLAESEHVELPYDEDNLDLVSSKQLLLNLLELREKKFIAVGH